jgi:2-polyprenyl-6-hydroxyphenyl methylase/3-demethylubiquinone-9 3-methyltransferase
VSETHQDELRRGDRFAFGDNWASFLGVLDDARIRRAEKSLQESLECERLDGKTFLDVGSGSGLFSLAARRLGATVRSFDFDPQSVACTTELRRRYFENDPAWTVGEGSALDAKFLGTLGRYDIVYSWGVLHHTGSMWKGLENVAPLVRDGGRLFIAIYNDQGGLSRWWLLIKRGYNKLPGFLKMPYAVAVMGPRELLRFVKHGILKGRPDEYVRGITDYAERSTRGMSYWHDVVDWVGGYPFEVATREEILEFYRARGFELRKLRSAGSGLGCNEFVFERAS